MTATNRIDKRGNRARFTVSPRGLPSIVAESGPALRGEGPRRRPSTILLGSELREFSGGWHPLGTRAPPTMGPVLHRPTVLARAYCRYDQASPVPTISSFRPRLSGKIISATGLA